MVQLKICFKCGKEKEPSEFHKNKDHKDGLASRCKECQSTYRKEHYEANKEKVKIQSEMWYEANKERKHKVGKEWIKNNHEKHLEIHRRYRKNNHEKYLNRIKLWRRNNPDKHSVIRNRHHAKRRRDFGFIPINDKKPGDAGHHINRNDVIYIPEKIHRSVSHSQDDLVSMKQINTLAMEYV